tara:strand:+ start:11591 stop:11806 length:216 start_codon:yes stop_codon:yes gene_type:complete
MAKRTPKTKNFNNKRYYLQVDNIDKKGAVQFSKMFKKYNKGVRISKSDTAIGKSKGLYAIYTSSISGNDKK